MDSTFYDSLSGKCRAHYAFMYVSMYVFMLTCVLSVFVSMHTYECNYACMNVWVHAASDWSVGNRVQMMGDGEIRVQSGGGLVGDGATAKGWSMEETRDA